MSTPRNVIPIGDLPISQASDQDYLITTSFDGREAYRTSIPQITTAAQDVQNAIDGMVDNAQVQIDAILSGLGYLPPVPYAEGIVVDNTRLTVSFGGVVFAANQSSIPFTTGTSFNPDQWRVIQGVVGLDLASASGAGMVGYDSSSPYQGGTVGEKLKELDTPIQKILILSSGQSNMPQDVAFDWSPEPNLFIWNYNSNYQPADVVGTEFIPASSSSMGPSLVAANVIAKENPRALVYVVNIHRGGLGLINWSSTPTDYNFRQAIQGNVGAALSLIGKSKIDYFVWGGCESDANAQSQTIQVDMENWLIVFLKSNSWFDPHTPIYILGMSPYAQSSPGNGDYLWRRYNNALRAVVSFDSSSRAYIGLDNFPESYFDPTGILPYIHRTPLGYYKSGEKLGISMQHGIYEPVPRLLDTDGLFNPDILNPVQCAVTVGYAAFTRIGNNIRCSVFLTVDSLQDNDDISFDITVPVIAKGFPNNVMGCATSNLGGSGIVYPLSNSQSVRVGMRPPIGVQTVIAEFMYRVNSSDALPNPPPGTT